MDNFLRVSYERAFGKKARGFARAGYGYMSDSYYPTNVTDYARTSKDKTQYHIGVLQFGAESNMLNDNLYPNAGYEWRGVLSMSLESSRYTPQGDKSLRGKYHGRGRIAAEGLWRKFFRVHRKFSLGVMANAMGTLQQLKQDYTATLIHAAAFAPTPSTENYFNEAFRSDNFVAAGVIPVWNPIGKLQLRGDFYLYSPIRNLRADGDRARYDGWFRKAEFIGEVAAVYNFNFASLSIYGNYLSYPAKNWNIGINFGLLFRAPRLLR